MTLAESKTLSVVVTVYNGARFLPRFFSCLEGQTYQDFRLIIINDGSKDNSIERIKDYCFSHENATFVDSVNEGVASARDKGVVLASGKYLTFCDVDDILDPSHFENLVNAIQTNNADMAVCGFKRISERKGKKLKKKVKNAIKKPLEFFNRQDGLTQYFSQKKFDYVLWNKIFLLKTVKDSGARFLEGTRYGEESYFIYTFLKHANLTVFSKAKTYYYVQCKSSLMHTGFKTERLDIFKNINAVLQNSLQYNQEVANYVSAMRAGYSCGMLLFIKKGKFKDGKCINEIISYLQFDCKRLRACKKTACYRKLLIPLVIPFAKLVFRKELKANKKLEKVI